ncbi:hypothetical protein D3C77_750390 [compost metagenome]
MRQLRLALQVHGERLLGHVGQGEDLACHLEDEDLVVEGKAGGHAGFGGAVGFEGLEVHAGSLPKDQAGEQPS